MSLRKKHVSKLAANLRYSKVINMDFKIVCLTLIISLWTVLCLECKLTIFQSAVLVRKHLK